MFSLQERAGWVPALINTHGHFIRSVLHQMQDAVSSLTIEQVHALYHSMTTFGQKINKHPVIKSVPRDVTYGSVGVL